MSPSETAAAIRAHRIDLAVIPSRERSRDSLIDELARIAVALGLSIDGTGYDCVDSLDLAAAVAVTVERLATARE